MQYDTSIGRGLSALVGAIVGNPAGEARTEADIALMRQRAADAQLQEQTADAQRRATEMILNGDVRGGMAMMSTIGPLANFEGPSGVYAMDNPQDERMQSIIQAATGIQSFPNTSEGQGRNLSSLESRNAADNAARLGVANINNAGAMERTLAALVPTIVDGVPTLTPVGEAAGARPVLPKAEEQGAIISQAADAILNGGTVDPNVIEIAGARNPLDREAAALEGDLDRANAVAMNDADNETAIQIAQIKQASKLTTGLTDEDHQMIENSLAVYMDAKQVDPALFAQVLDRVAQAKAQGIPVPRAIASVVGQIQGDGTKGEWFSSDSPYTLPAQPPPQPSGPIPSTPVPGSTIAQSQPGGAPRISSAEEWQALPSGTRYIDPDGVMRVKP